MSIEVFFHALVSICEAFTSCSQVFLIYDVVAVEYCPRLVSADLHSHPLGRPGPDHVPYCRTPAIVEELARKSGPSACAVPSFPEVLDWLAISEKYELTFRILGIPHLLLVQYRIIQFPA